MRDYSILIEAATVLGGTIVSIEPGTVAAGSHPHSETLLGTVSGGPLESLNQVASIVTDNQNSIESFIQNLESASADLAAITSRVQAGEGLIGQLLSDDELAATTTAAVDSAAQTFENFETLTDNVVAGQGVVGKLFSDEDLSAQFTRLANNIEALSTDVASLVNGVSQGQGTLGKLFVEDVLHDETLAAIESIKNIAKSNEDGDGTIGHLINDPAMRDDLDLIISRLADGEGTIGKLFADGALHDDIAATVASIRTVADRLAVGEGTIGKLLAHDDLYVELQRALRTVNRSLEEFREVAPITAFSNVLFGVF